MCPFGRDRWLRRRTWSDTVPEFPPHRRARGLSRRLRGPGAAGPRHLPIGAPGWAWFSDPRSAVILLAASGVLFYVRFHHPPLQVTRVAIVRSGRAGCTVTVAGQISTNGAAGMITYQWLFPVGSPLTRHQSVSAGQHSVNVQVTVEGSGNGTASQRVWLQVLHPDRRIASKDILVRCHERLPALSRHQERVARPVAGLHAGGGEDDRHA